MLRSPDVNVRLSTKLPINPNPGSPAPSSPIPQCGSSSSVGSPPPTDTPQYLSSMSELPQAEMSPRPPARPPPEPPFNLPSQLTAVPAHSTRVPLPTSLSPQPPSVTPPSTGSAPLARITRPIHDTHLRGVSKGDSAFLGDMSTTTPSHGAEVAGHVPSHRPDPGLQHNVTGVVTPGPLSQQQVQTVVPTLQVPAPETQKRKRNWFQKYVYDYAK